MSRARHRSAGFTLIEVMVALLIMAILAGLAFRGIDALARAKDAALSSTDRTLKMNTGMSQFEYDMSQVVDSKVLPRPIMFDGATLRVARRSPAGIQLVLWTLQDHRWQRWASPAYIHMTDLTDAWMRSQQWDAISGSAVTVLANVDDFQVYVCNPATIATSGCSWNNVQSTQGAAAAALPPVSAVSGVQATPVTTTQPNGIRILLKVPEGEITRERELPRFGGIPTT
jgi:general secretion pathway protein J